MNLLFFLKPGLYVSKQTVINGNVTTDANGSVAGTIHGNVVTKATLVVENNGLITGNAYAKNVIVKGKINGDVHSEGKVDIIKDGEISGQIFATVVNAQEGSLKKGITHLKLVSRKKKKKNLKVGFKDLQSHKFYLLFFYYGSIYINLKG